MPRRLLGDIALRSSFLWAEKSIQALDKKFGSWDNTVGILNMIAKG